jgi:predicted SnoaL-like aldol condensation-catalyzing enzyme
MHAKHRIELLAIVGMAFAAASGAALAADNEASQAVPAKNVSAAQREANKKVVREFFRPGITAQERYALLDDGYIQHNPMAKQYADTNHLSYKEGFLKLFTSRPFPTPPTEINGVKVPAGNDLYMVLAEGDLVFVMRQTYRQDPTNKSAVTFYPAYDWDVFRVRNGKLYEHWDGATIRAMGPPPGAAAPSGPPGAN